MTVPGAATKASPIVSGTTPQPSSSSSSTADATNALATQQIAGNFQSFLQLLTTQLQNQNPLDPLDTNQFTQQLVEFAGVQQQLNTNSSLSTLVSLQQSAQSTQALSFVGKTATVNGSTATMTNSQANWALDIPKNCTLTVTIANSSGQTVFTGNYSATAGDAQPFSWNGKGNDGTQWPDGKYKMTATAQDSSGNSVAVSTDIQGVVSSVDLTQTPPLLTIAGQTYTVNQIKGISG
ncbi:MAG TPA: flagellar hook capping FlgD N-terminal domain-containing protein [Bradyrhizobium sp.]|nr:flagellar hook capping FlgD N-terminal domain-containing protein [Bradyrhizobium sp.]